MFLGEGKNKTVIALAVNLMNFLKGPKQFIIYIYQRTRNWTLKECGQFPIFFLSLPWPGALIGTCSGIWMTGDMENK
jgi:hypothetical protein